jgi:hypothetical protein
MDNGLPRARPLAPGVADASRGPYASRPVGAPLDAAGRVTAQERLEAEAQAAAERKAAAAVDDGVESIVPNAIKELNERRALALLVTEFVRRKHAKRLLPSAGDAAIAFQITDLLGQIPGGEASALDPAFAVDGEDILPKGPPVNPAVDRAMRRSNKRPADGGSAAGGQT